MSSVASLSRHVLRSDYLKAYQLTTTSHIKHPLNLLGWLLTLGSVPKSCVNMSCVQELVEERPADFLGLESP